VFSRTLTEAGWNTEIRREVDPDEIRAHDLVDEWRRYVNPVLLGRGNRTFADADARTDLRLAESRAFGNGVLLLRYERTNA